MTLADNFRTLANAVEQLETDDINVEDATLLDQDGERNPGEVHAQVTISIPTETFDQREPDSVDRDADADAGERDAADDSDEPEDESEPTADSLEDLPPTQRKDYRAVKIEGKSLQQQADDRGVTQSAVSHNVSVAKERLGDTIDDEPDGSLEHDEDESSTESVSVDWTPDEPSTEPTADGGEIATVQDYSNLHDPDQDNPAKYKRVGQLKADIADAIGFEWDPTRSKGDSQRFTVAQRRAIVRAITNLEDEQIAEMGSGALIKAIRQAAETFESEDNIGRDSNLNREDLKALHQLLEKPGWWEKR